MDMATVLYYLFGVISAVYVIHFGFYLAGANVYDIWQLLRRHAMDLGHSRAPYYHPLVTVLVPAHNEEKVIIRCLESIRAGVYKNIEVIVVNDASKDATAAIVRAYKREHPEMALRLINKRKNVGKGGALNYALRRYAAGELMIVIDADSLLMPYTVRNATRYFVNPAVAGVAANVQIIPDFTVLGVLQKFEHLIGYRSKKVYSLTNCEFVVGGVASTYRMDVLRTVGYYDTDTITEDIGLSMKIITNGNRAYRVLYGVDVIAMTEGVASFRALLKQRFRWKYGSMQNILKHAHMIGANDVRFTRMLTVYRLPMALLSELALLLSPLLWGYVLYVTFVSHSLVLVVGAYLTITGYTLLTIWQDEHMPVIERFHLSLYAPLAYFIYYVMDVVQFVAVLRCLARARWLARRKNIGTTWVSPDRVGRDVAVGSA